jgi:hypothetical protein
VYLCKNRQEAKVKKLLRKVEGLVEEKAHEKRDILSTLAQEPSRREMNV